MSCRPSGARRRPRALVPRLGDSRGRRRVGCDGPAGQRGDGRGRRLGLCRLPGAAGGQERPLPRGGVRRGGGCGAAGGGAVRHRDVLPAGADRRRCGFRPSPAVSRSECPADRLVFGVHRVDSPQAAGRGLAAGRIGRTAGRRVVLARRPPRVRAARPSRRPSCDPGRSRLPGDDGRRGVDSRAAGPARAGAAPTFRLPAVTALSRGCPPCHRAPRRRVRTVSGVGGPTSATARSAMSASSRSPSPAAR